MLNLLLSIFVLGLIITIHECGHFLLAKLFGVGVVEFSIGMGPTVLSRVWGNTRYSLRMLPFGGSCMMVGEEAEENGLPASGEESGESEGSSTAADAAPDGDWFEIDGRRYGKAEQFVEKAAWKRFLIIAAGPCFNFLLAFLLSLVITAQAGVDRPIVMQVEAGMPAAEAGVTEQDLVTRIGIAGKGNSRIRTSRDLMLYLTVHAKELNEKKMVLLWLRGDAGSDAERVVKLQPRYAESTGTYRLGLSYNSAYLPANGFGELVGFSAHNVVYCINSTIQSLKLLVRGDVGRQDVMGPVRMVATMDETVSEAADYGFVTAALTLMNLVILISGSLGAMNLLPIPALDGGRLFFILIELVARRPVPRELEGRIHAIGMALLLTLMVFILFNDVSMLLAG